MVANRLHQTLCISYNIRIVLVKYYKKQMRTEAKIAFGLGMSVLISGCGGDNKGVVMHPTPFAEAGDADPSDLVPWTETSRDLRFGEFNHFYLGAGRIPFQMAISESGFARFRAAVSENSKVEEDEAFLFNFLGLDACTGGADGYQAGEFALRVSPNALVVLHVYPRFADQNLNDPLVRGRFYREIEAQLIFWFAHEMLHKHHFDNNVPNGVAENEALRFEHLFGPNESFFVVSDPTDEELTNYWDVYRVGNEIDYNALWEDESRRVGGVCEVDGIQP